MRQFIVSVAWFVLLAPSASRADILFYPIPGTGHAFQLQGEAKINTGGIVSFRHAEFGVLYFDYEKVRFFKVPSTRSLAQRQLKKAKQDQEACLEAARWALHHGLLSDFNKAAAAAWQLNPEHPTLKRLANLKRRMRAPLPILKEQEDEIRVFVPTGKDSEFVRSDHFLLMHNTKPPKNARRKGRKPIKTPAEQRLELLETVYETFLLKFYFEGFELEIPKKRLKVVLFAHRNDFDAFSDATKAEYSKAAGFYNKRSNTAVFYDQGTGKVFESLDRVNKDLKEKADLAMKRHSPNVKDIVRLSKTLNVVCEVAKKSQDIEVVTHEATHQMAANTGLMPNEAAVPVWVAEGIATYFESPSDAAWAGVGTVNEGRLTLYRAMAHDAQHSNLDYIVSDDIFMRANSDQEIANAYGQAWALTHFLMARHFDKLMEYYKQIGARRSKDRRQFPPDQNLAVFKKVFGDDTAALGSDWHRYMKSLKTDVERVLEGE